MYLKRQKVPKSWPIFRKGMKYVVKPRFDAKRGLPLLVILREMLGVVQTRKEAKKTIHMKHILVNTKPSINEKNNVLLFDTITLIPSKKHFRLELSNKGKFEVKEIKENETDYKIAKIINKKILKGRKTQLNLSDGRNFFSDTKCKVNDSVLINFKKKKIERCLPIKEKMKVIIFAGKHAGKKGNLIKIDSKKKIAELNSDGKSINVLIKQLMVVE
jgi:small subunit ribosomal protein S4e